MQTWPFRGVTRVLHASARRGGGGGEGGGRGGGGRAGTRGEGVRVGAGEGERSSGEGWGMYAGPCSCPLDRSEVRIPLACLADLRERRNREKLICKVDKTIFLLQL